MKRLGVLVFALLLLAPATASAGVASVKEQRSSNNHCIVCEVRYVAAPGEVNEVTASDAPGSEQILIEDKTSAVAAGAGCTAQPGGHSALCDARFHGAAGAQGMKLTLRDGDDSAQPNTQLFFPEIDGGSGADHLYGGSGALMFGGPGDDVIVGGPNDDSIGGGGGNDRIDVSNDPGPVEENSWQDDVDCHAPSRRSSDTVMANANDNVGPGCRHVSGNPQSRVDTIHADADTVDVAGFEPEVSYEPFHVFLSRLFPARLRGRVRFVSSCVARSTCRGRLTIRAAGHGAVLGTGRYRVRPHRRPATATVRLNSRGRRLLRRHRRVPAELYVAPAGRRAAFGDELLLKRG
jgi:hypothetical protein